MLPRLRAARATAAAELDAFEDHLRATILPASSGEGRLGPELFAAKLAHTMRDPSITTEHIRAEAEREFAAVRAEMVRIAREIAPHWLGDGPIPDDDGAARPGGHRRDRRRASRRRTACSTSVGRAATGSRRSAASAA